MKRSANSNALRSEIRKRSRQNQYVLKSLQPCGISQIKLVLDKAVTQCETKRPEFLAHLKGLRAVLQILLAELPARDTITVRKSYSSFEDAFELFQAYSLSTDSEEYCKDGKKRFRELLCHPNYGLPVYIINHAIKGEYILLRPDGVDLEDFFERVYGDDKEEEPFETRLTVDKDFVRAMLASADTEWDRKLLRVLLGSTKSLSELKNLGMSCDDIGKKTAEVLAVIQQKSEQHLNALQAINENLGNKLEDIRSTIKEKQNIIEKYNDHWPAERLDDL